MTRKIIAYALGVLGLIIGVGAAILPVSTTATPCPAYANALADDDAVSCDVTVNANVGMVINMSVWYVGDEGGSYINASTTDNAIRRTIQPDTKLDIPVQTKIFTNDTTGYSLTVQDADANTSLVMAGTDNSIPASSSVAAGTSGWGITKSDNATGAADTGNYFAIPASTSSARTIRDVSAQSTSFVDHITNFDIGVAASNGQIAGTYTDDIVLTVHPK